MKSNPKILMLLICFVAMFNSFRANAQNVIEVCADAPNFILSFDPQSLPQHMFEGNGQPAEFFIDFGKAMSETIPQTYGNFTNFTTPISGTVNAGYKIIVPIPQENPKIFPNHYDNVRVYLKNTINNCEFPLTSLQLKILYPTSIFKQKWDNAIGILNQYYNGDYEFTGCQWYKNGTKLNGEISSNLYFGVNHSVAIGDKYSVKLERADGTSVFSCPFVVVYIQMDPNTNYPKVVSLSYSCY